VRCELGNAGPRVPSLSAAANTRCSAATDRLRRAAEKFVLGLHAPRGAVDTGWAHGTAGSTDERDAADVSVCLQGSYK
jgi:hypothetical protein